MEVLSELDSPLDKAEYLQNMLIARATGGEANNQHYMQLRSEFMGARSTKDLLPTFVRTNRDISQFWSFIKYKFSSYAERREFIYEKFIPFFEYLEGKGRVPSDQSISDVLSSFDTDGVHAVWEKALERRNSDPEGAITAARTLLETVCKHILDQRSVEYNSKKVELHELYRLVAWELNLAPNQHAEEIFKQILGSCSGIVNGLGTLRNRLGDAHGQGKLPVKPAPRHAELAVNLAGSVALFLVQTFDAAS